mgnify:CR=1 FL=1
MGQAIELAAIISTLNVRAVAQALASPSLSGTQLSAAPRGLASASARPSLSGSQYTVARQVVAEAEEIASVISVLNIRARANALASPSLSGTQMAVNALALARALMSPSLSGTQFTVARAVLAQALTELTSQEITQTGLALVSAAAKASIPEIDHSGAFARLQADIDDLQSQINTLKAKKSLQV